MSDSSKVQNTRLSVNVNKIATLRNARGGSIPDLLKAAARSSSLSEHKESRYIQDQMKDT